MLQFNDNDFQFPGIRIFLFIALVTKIWKANSFYFFSQMLLDYTCFTFVLLIPVYRKSMFVSVCVCVCVCVCMRGFCYCFTQSILRHPHLPLYPVQARYYIVSERLPIF